MPRRGRLRCLTSRNRTRGTCYPIHNTSQPPNPCAVSCEISADTSELDGRSLQQLELPHISRNNKKNSTYGLVITLGHQKWGCWALGSRSPQGHGYSMVPCVYSSRGPYYIVENNHCPPSDAGKWGLSAGFWDVREANSRLGRYPAISREDRLGRYQIGPLLLSGVSWFAQNPIFEAPTQERHMVLQSHDVSNFNSHY